MVEIQSMPALRGFTMHLPRGAMVSLVGRNGAGKTTLMRSIMGHLKASQGTVRFDGADLSSLSAPCARGTGNWLHAGRSLPGSATDGGRKYHAAAMGGETHRPQGAARLRLRGDRRGHRDAPAQGAAAERRRANWSHSAARSPSDKCLLLDEPFEGIAPALSERLSEVLASLRGKDLTLLMSQST